MKTTTTKKTKKPRYIKFNQIKVGDRLRISAYGKPKEGGIEYLVKVRVINPYKNFYKDGITADFVPVSCIGTPFEIFHHTDAGAGHFDNLHNIQRLPKNKKFPGEK